MTPSEPWYPHHSKSGAVHEPIPGRSGARRSKGMPTRRRGGITPLQVKAWTVANVSFQVPDGRSYRMHATELYQQDMHERIMLLFGTLDSQNARIDAALAAGPDHRVPGLAAAPPETG